jgi:hypothetical protein
VLYTFARLEGFYCLIFSKELMASRDDGSDYDGCAAEGIETSESA